jgi:hypothetical protein
VYRAKQQFLFLSLLTLFLMSSLSSACIGLVAGRVQFNVTVGTSETLQMQIFNACRNQSIGYQSAARFSPVANQSTPRVTISPANGTIPPAGQAFLNITVYMPYNATPGTVWHGGAVAGEVVSSSGAGATVTTGVVKQITAVAVAAPVNYALYAVVAIAVAAGAAGAYYLRMAKRAAKPAKVAKRARKRVARKKPAGKKARRRTAKKAKASRRRRR